MADGDLRQAQLTLVRVFDAPPALVFKAWTEPQRAALWWGPQGFEILSCQMDVRPGGRWRMRMRSPSGTEHVKSGVYQQVMPPEALVFTWAWEDQAGVPGHQTIVSIRLQAQGSATRLTLHQAVFESVTARDAHHLGWSSCLQRFGEYLARL